MGDRAQVLMENSGVYLYTHWGGSGLLENVKTAIARKQRWTDEDYLTRIIFEQMVGEEQGSETGFGIGTKEHGDIEHPIIIINVEKQLVKFRKAAFADDPKIEPMSFDKFLTFEMEEF